MMNKLRESIYVILSVIILSIAVIMFVRPNDKVDKENDNSNQYNKESENSVDEETIKEILDESTNKNVIDKVNSYIKSGKYYYVQEDVKYNERIYKTMF